MKRHLVIEERHGGIVRISNGSSIDVTGRNLEEAFLNAMTAAGVSSAYDMPTGSYEAAEVFDTLMGARS